MVTSLLLVLRLVPPAIAVYKTDVDDSDLNTYHLISLRRTNHHLHITMPSDNEQSASVSSTPTAAAFSIDSDSPKCPFVRSRQESSTDSMTSSYYSIKQDPSDPHCYRRPTKDDIRGPCPALNTLANHGYL